MKISEELIRSLKGCRWVKKITEKQIVYTSKFKIESVEQYLRGVSPNLIFSNAGIPVELLSHEYTNNCLKRWTKLYKAHGIDSLKDDKRGTIKSTSRGRPRKNTDKLTYEELEAIVKIQTEVIETLKKKRALAQRK